ncbi:MAG: hypothetical protein JW944_13950 [Deltaproteobacteria bacterium]|nr:hypothetical protein [Deltaproteobacteria bacterium]
MKEIDSIQKLKELSNEFQNMKGLSNPTDGLPNFYTEDYGWGERFLEPIEEIENIYHKKVKGNDSHSTKHT